MRLTTLVACAALVAVNVQAQQQSYPPPSTNPATAGPNYATPGAVGTPGTGTSIYGQAPGTLYATQPPQSAMPGAPRYVAPQYVAQLTPYANGPALGGSPSGTTTQTAYAPGPNLLPPPANMESPPTMPGAQPSGNSVNSYAPPTSNDVAPPPGTSVMTPENGMTEDRIDTFARFSKQMHKQGTGWVGGASVYVLRPVWTGGNGATMQRTVNNNGVFDRNTTPFDYGVSAVPALWLGYVAPTGNGARVNFFRFDQKAYANYVNPSGTTVVDPFAFGNSGMGLFSFNAGSLFQAESILQITTADIEATHQRCDPLWNWTIAAGVRYANLQQNYVGSVTNPSSAFSQIDSNRRLNGAGPTVAFQGRRGIADSKLGVFGAARGALVFGTSKQVIQESLPGTTVTATDTITEWQVLPFVQLEAGIDYRYPLAGSTIIIENAFVGQTWFGAGSSSNTNVLDGATSNANLGLFGLRSSIGLAY
ncbi:MAG: hypothetical protein JSS27_16855 [Planctomycetes bacterium]|nr:hypothetical protein [Planctomycetota bacterium]